MTKLINFFIFTLSGSDILNDSTFIIENWLFFKIFAIIFILFQITLFSPYFKATTLVQDKGEVTVQGKIGALHGLDLSSPVDTVGLRSNRIFSLGCSSIPDPDFQMLFSKIESGRDAFSFELKRKQEANYRQNLTLQVDTASLCYLHSPKLGY